MGNSFWKFAAITCFILLILLSYLHFGVRQVKSPTMPPKTPDSIVYEEKSSIVLTEQVDELEKRKEELRQYWPKLIRVDLVQYTPRSFGGMSNVFIQVRNHMEFDAELIQVEVQYLLTNGKVYKTIEVPVANIPANGMSQKIKIEDSRRGKTLRMNPVKLVCKAIEPEPPL